ncbi:hypothetical protein V6Z93_009622 [Aspergillus fumigatus]
MSDQRSHGSERQQAASWLCSTDYASEQIVDICERQDGTGQWIFETDEFREWEKEKHGQNDDIAFSFIFCNFQQQENQKLDTILASILGQLIRGLCHIPEQIQTFYKTYQRNEMQPQLGDILQMLDVTLRLYSHVYIIIDALDECSDFDGMRTHLISHVLDLQRHLNISFMATARFLPDIISKIQNFPSVEIRASDADVKRYVESNLPTMVRRRSDIHDFVSSEILKIADGMFSIARVYLDSLKGKCSITAIKKALDKCKTGWEVYEQAYEKEMKQIWQQIGDRAELAKRALAWLTFARRALTLTELQHALALVVGESSFDEENLPDVEEMICSCSGLIIYNEKDHIVSLAHYTMQEYLEKTWTSWFPNAHRAIGEVCVSCYDDFEGRGCGREYNYEERCRKYPLYAYATESWLYHARKQPLDHSLVGKLLMSDEKFDAWVQSLKEETTRLQLAVELGLEDEVEALLNNRYQVNARDRCLSTAFQIAVGKGHERLAMLLHRYGARPVADMYTAAKIGCESNFLGQGGEMNLKDGHVWTMLADARASTDSRNIDTTTYGLTPLCLAAKNGHPAGVRLLLEEGANPNLPDKNGTTPLMHALAEGHSEVVYLLLEAGAQKESTPLEVAVENNKKSAIRNHLAHGANYDLLARESSLSWTINNRDQEAV